MLVAEAELAKLAAAVRERILRRIMWLGENAEAVIHHRLSNMPDDLAGLCKLRVGDYRVLYWVSTAARTIQIFRVRHRREAYRDL
ncbi:MAG: type II toxin-antitoxin system RelE/ParE family toxin [Phycisphaerae bacterium]